MTTPEGLRVPVVRITASAQTPRWWRLELGCGHVLWVGAPTEPDRRVATCLSCEREAGR